MKRVNQGAILAETPRAGVLEFISLGFRRHNMYILRFLAGKLQETSSACMTPLAGMWESIGDAHAKSVTMVVAH